MKKEHGFNFHELSHLLLDALSNFYDDLILFYHVGDSLNPEEITES